jgi:hypothetical protein
VAKEPCERDLRGCSAEFARHGSDLGPRPCRDGPPRQERDPCSLASREQGSCSRSSRLYRFCTLATSMIFRARSSSVTVTSDSPIRPTLPSFWISRAPT